MTIESKAVNPITVPDIGTTGDVLVIEVLVRKGDTIEIDTPLITLESEKASMEVPSPEAGIVDALQVKVGDKVKMGSTILTLIKEGGHKEIKKPEAKLESSQSHAEKPEKKEEKVEQKTQVGSSAQLYASPIVRRLARELDIDLNRITGSGAKSRIQKEDLLRYIKSNMGGGGAVGQGLPQAPVIDFNQFGETESKPLSKIKKLTAVNLHRNWLLVPHVTQFDEADITDLDDFRKTQAEKNNLKLTPVVFIMKAVVETLKHFPQFNASLDSKGENLILKKYFHIGIAVDTPDGLVVPVIRDVDKKSLSMLAAELTEVSQKARNKQLLPKDMQGSSFTISSLGGVGGTRFTPIVNLPDVAILGVSRSQIKPVYKDGTFVPRLMLPLSLSYDHRVIDGAEGARFIVQLSQYLSDVRLLLV